MRLCHLAEAHTKPLTKARYFHTSFNFSPLKEKKTEKKRYL